MHHHHLTSLLSSLFSGNNGDKATAGGGRHHTDQSLSISVTNDDDSIETSSSLEEHLIALPYTLEAWKLMKNNDPKKTMCNLNGCDFLPSSVWKEMGEILATNTRVHELYAENCQLSEENFTALMNGLKFNESIKTLNFQNNPELGMTMAKLSTHLQTSYWKNNLVVLTLCRTNLTDTDLRTLLPGLNGTKIRQLFLNNNRLGVAKDKLRMKENLSYTFDKLEMPELEELYLVGNEMGKEGCQALQYLLRKDNTRLKHLSLFRNHFDDACCRLLSEGLKDNSSLESMYIGSNDANEREPITFKGWRHFLNLICDDSSIQKTYFSNHVIHDFGDVDSSRVRHGIAASSYIPLVLHEILKINASSLSPSSKGRRKVATVHFNGEYNLKLLQMEKIQLMPHVIGFIGKECNLQAIYHLTQNTPELFDYLI